MRKFNPQLARYQFVGKFAPSPEHEGIGHQLDDGGPLLFFARESLDVLQVIFRNIHGDFHTFTIPESDNESTKNKS